jgi:phosphocarrier protein
MKRTVTLQNTTGLHATLASKIVALAGKYDAHVEIEYENQVIDAKSILGLLSLAIPYGENLLIITSGNQAEEAMTELQKLLQKDVQK